MLPYVIVSPIKLGFLTLQPFGLLVACGVALTWTLATLRGKRLGFVYDDLQSFLWWMTVGGFVGAHLFETVFYHPQEILDDPLVLLKFWKGISSFGGFAGATLGGFAWKYYRLEDLRAEGPLRHFLVPVRRRKAMPLLPYADVMLAAFPIGWIFGRTGCAITHDHPGALAPANSWLSVAYGPGKVVDYGLFQLRYGNTPRYDLGLLELMCTVVITLAFVLTWRFGGAKGYYVVASALVYAPMRFLLDFLRKGAAEGGDARYAQLTPAQWSCIVLFIYGFWVLHQIRQHPALPIANRSG